MNKFFYIMRIGIKQRQNTITIATGNGAEEAFIEISTIVAEQM